MTQQDNPETWGANPQVSVFYALKLHTDNFMIHDGGEVSLVDRETLTLLLKQFFIEETNHD